MGIQSVHKQTESSSKNNDQVITIEESYLVVTDSKMSADDVRTSGHQDLPQLRDNHPDQLTARVVDVSVTRLEATESQKTYTYDVEYSSERDGQELPENPLNADPIVDWSTSEASEKYFVDQNGDQVKNSIGQEFEELPKRKTSKWSVTVKVNQQDYDVSDALSKINTVNNSQITISDGNNTWAIPADNALLMKYDPSTLKNKNGIEYYEVTYQLDLNPDGWNASEKYEDYGTFEKDGQHWKPVLDTAGNEITERLPLDGNGNRVPPDGTVGQISFKPYKEKDLTGLPLS